MGTSFNHKYRELIDAPGPASTLWQCGEAQAIYWDNLCRSGKNCHSKMEAQISSDYVTGRAGRVSNAYKCICREHLDKFLKKNPSAVECEAIDYKDHMRPFLKKEQI